MKGDMQIVLDYLKSIPSMEGGNLICDIGTEKIVEHSRGKITDLHFALIDCGIKKGLSGKWNHRKSRLLFFPLM